MAIMSRKSYTKWTQQQIKLPSRLGGGGAVEYTNCTSAEG